MRTHKHVTFTQDVEERTIFRAYGVDLIEESTNKLGDGTFRTQLTVGNGRQVRALPHSSNSGYIRVDFGIPTTWDTAGWRWTI